MYSNRNAKIIMESNTDKTLFHIYFIHFVATIDWFRWIRLNELIPLHNWDVVSLVDNAAFHLNDLTFEEDVRWMIH